METIRPAIHWVTALRHTEACADTVVNVNLGGLARGLPCREQRETTVRDVEVRRADNDTAARRKADDADALRIDAPLLGAAAHERQRRLRIGHGD